MILTTRVAAGNGHRTILKKARDFPKHYALVYYFGSHELCVLSGVLPRPTRALLTACVCRASPYSSLVPLNKGVVLKPWDCDEKDTFLKGHPKHLAKRKAVMDDLVFSIQEAEDFLSQPEDIRLPPYFVPSDLDPTLEPPPKVTPEEEEEDLEGMEGEQEGDVDMEDAEGGAGPEDHKEDASDAETKKKPKKTKEKKEKPAKKKKEKKSKEKKSEGKKRKKAGDGDSHEKDEKPAKVAKVKPESDVKAEKQEEPAASVPASKEADADEKQPKQEALEGDELTAKLEKEIRWILLNCQFEEMTTKTVRKLLERRLGMDLRHHKAQIKEGVARVIESMEDGADGAANANGESDEAAVKLEAGEDKPAADKEEDVKAEDAKDEVKDVKENATDVKEDVREEKEDVKDVKEEKKEKEDVKEEKGEDEAKPKEEKELSVAERLADAASRLEASSTTDEQVVEVLGSLESISSVDREVLVKSKLHARLVALRSHSSAVVKDKVAALAKQWDVEAALARKKEVDERRLLELKAKLESADTSHDDICACLDELAEVRTCW